MFCKKCGTQIAEDSKFCNSCGAKQDEEPEVVFIKQTYCANCGYPVTDEIICPKCKKIVETTTKPPIKRFSILNFISWIFVIAVIVVIIAVIAMIVKSNSEFDKNQDSSYQSSNNSQGGLLSREATVNDIECSSSINTSSLATIIYITPKCDINDLEIKISFYDENENLLKTITKTIGDVEKGEEIQRTIPLSDFPNVFKIDSATITVTDGEVPYIQ